jgi:hypothetical protein
MADMTEQRSGLVMGAYYADEAAVRQMMPAAVRMAVAVVGANGRGVQVVRLKNGIANSSDWDAWDRLLIGARQLYGGGNVSIITNVPEADQSRFNDEIRERIRVNTVNHLV